VNFKIRLELKNLDCKELTCLATVLKNVI